MVNEACLSMGRKPAQTWRRMEVLFTNISVLREASGCAVKLISSSTKVHPFKQYSTEVVNSIVLSEQKRLLAVLICFIEEQHHHHHKPIVKILAQSPFHDLLIKDYGSI